MLIDLIAKFLSCFVITSRSTDYNGHLVSGLLKNKADETNCLNCVD